MMDVVVSAVDGDRTKKVSIKLAAAAAAAAGVDRSPELIDELAEVASVYIE